MLIDNFKLLTYQLDQLDHKNKDDFKVRSYKESCIIEFLLFKLSHNSAIEEIYNFKLEHHCLNI